MEAPLSFGYCSEKALCSFRVLGESRAFLPSGQDGFWLEKAWVDPEMYLTSTVLV